MIFFFFDECGFRGLLLMAGDGTGFSASTLACVLVKTNPIPLS